MSIQPSEEESQFISKSLWQSSIFKELDSCELNNIIPLCNPQYFDEDDVIINQCDVGDEFYVVIDGFVVVTKKGEDKETFIATLGPSDHFGEAALFGDYLRIATIKGQTRGCVLVIKSLVFKEFLKTYPVATNKILFKILENIFARLEMSNRELGTHHMDNMAQKAIDNLFM